MKKLKLYQVIAGIACVTSSQINGMDLTALHGTLTKSAAVCGNLASSLATGASNQLWGFADPLMREIDALNVDPIDTKRDHRYENAIDQLIRENDPERLFTLIDKVNKHNATHTSLIFRMSPAHQSKIQEPLQKLYAKRRREYIAAITQQAQSLLPQWETDFDQAVLLASEHENTLSNMSGIIHLAGGQQPNDQSVREELERLFAIQVNYTFSAALSRLSKQRISIPSTATTSASSLQSASGSTSLSSSSSLLANAMISPATSSSSSSSSTSTDGRLSNPPPFSLDSATTNVNGGGSSEEDDDDGDDDDGDDQETEEDDDDDQGEKGDAQDGDDREKEEQPVTITIVTSTSPNTIAANTQNGSSESPNKSHTNGGNRKARKHNKKKK